MFFELDTLLPPKSQEWHDKRRGGLGGSDANIICSGDEKKIKNLWLEKTGQKEPDDLSMIIPVQMGSWTEPINLAFLAQYLGEQVHNENCTSLVHPEHDFMRANLDARTSGGAIAEAKHTSSMKNMDDMYKAYYAQTQHNMAVAEADKCYLSVFFGNWTHEYTLIERDDEYITRLIQSEREFWDSVLLESLPGGFLAMSAPPNRLR